MKYRYHRIQIMNKFADLMCNYRIPLNDKKMKDFLFDLVEPAEWPQEGDRYWFVHSIGTIEWEDWTGCDYELERKAFGNCFRTKKQAIKARDQIKSLLKEL